MNRPSSLPIAQFCSASAVLGNQHGAGRAAAVSTCYHAMAAGDEKSAQLFERLHPNEQKDLLEKKMPGVWPAGNDLDWRDTELPGGCEVPLAIVDSNGEVVSEGTADRVWVVDNGPFKVAYVADIKWTEWSSPDGLRSLQLHAYAIAACHKYECDSYILGIWNASEGEWSTSREYDLMDMSTMAIEDRVMAAARNTSGEYATGPHCHDCWSRLYCKEWLAPVSNPEHALMQVTAGEISPANASKALDSLKAIEDLTKLAKATLKAYADRNGGIVSDDGTKVWKGSAVKGRKSLDQSALEADNPGIVEKYTKTGAASTRYAWKKNK